jgi:hypothetical protein
VLSNFTSGDVVDLASVAFDSSGTATLSGSTLTIVESGQSYTLQFDSTVSGDTFRLVSDGVSGSDVVLSGATLTGQVKLTAATEHVALADSTTVATFTDANTSDTASSFTATIDWGDGTTTSGTVAGSNGAFTVTGGHTYADEGSDALSVTITRTADNAQITPTGTVTIAEDDALTPQGTAITATAGQSFSGTVASFTDTDTASGSGDFAATINWGDGTTTAGTVSGGSGTLTVSGDHTYSAAGTDTVTVTLSDNAPGTASATATSQATVNPQLVGQLVLAAATEHVALAGSTTVATFTDANTSDTASSFTATINWGDGTTTSGTVAGSNGAFTVTGGHAYADEGSFPLGVTITDSTKNTLTLNGMVAAAEADVLTAHPLTFTANPGQAFSGTVATFTDSDTGSVASDFSATINWGDGTTSAGVITDTAGAISVSGTHTYATAGRDAVMVTLTDGAPGTATATANSTANVVALAGQVSLTAAKEGAALPVTTRVATFTDTNSSDTASIFTATISWGDGTTTTGAVSGSKGTFTVKGGHTYADEGSFPLGVTITDTANNTSLSLGGTVAAAETDVLSAKGRTFRANAGQAFSGQVATFTDRNRGNVASDFSATIDWGDGTTTMGVITDKRGAISVSGTHTYASSGRDAVTVTLTDSAPGTATATAHSTGSVQGHGGHTPSLALLGQYMASSFVLPSDSQSGTPFTDPHDQQHHLSLPHAG